MSGVMVAPTFTELPPTAQHTAFLFGKPYHWALNAKGYLTLRPGATVEDEIRKQAFETMIAKGLTPFDITPEMIDQVIEKARAALDADTKED